MHVAIIGAGIIGLSIGWKLARAGFQVDIFERGLAAREASFAAAGMLCPDSEAEFQDSEFLALSKQSMELYPRFLKELSLDSGRALGFESRGTLWVAATRDDKAELDRRFSNMSTAEAMQLEPLLSPRIAGAYFLKDEAQIDNRAVLQALLAAFERRGGYLREEMPVDGVWEEGGVLKGLFCLQKRFPFDLVINAAGAWSDAPIYPNKGQILTLQMQPGLFLQRTIRTPRVYLAPKRSGLLRIGATSEDRGFDQSVTAGAVYDLLQAAIEAIPAVYEMELIETLARTRPLSEHRLPLLEETHLKHYYRAAGHGRSGILLAPLTAERMVHLCKST